MSWSSAVQGAGVGTRAVLWCPSNGRHRADPSRDGAHAQPSLRQIIDLDALVRRRCARTDPLATAPPLESQSERVVDTRAGTKTPHWSARRPAGPGVARTPRRPSWQTFKPLRQLGLVEREIPTSRRAPAVVHHQASSRIRLRRKVNTTVPARDPGPVLNLLERDFNAAEPNHRYAGDATYLHIFDGTNLYLATVIDCHSRLLTGCALADHVRTSLVDRPQSSQVHSHHLDRSHLPPRPQSPVHVQNLRRPVTTPWSHPVDGRPGDQRRRRSGRIVQRRHQTRTLSRRPHLDRPSDLSKIRSQGPLVLRRHSGVDALVDSTRIHDTPFPTRPHQDLTELIYQIETTTAEVRQPDAAAVAISARRATYFCLPQP